MMVTKPSTLNIRYIALICVLILANSCSADAQAPSERDAEPLPLDSTITYGRFHNGFTYFIKPILGSNRGITMKLIHKVGSNQEEDDQLDIAHAVEHMAFKESSNFPLGIDNSELLRNLGVENFKIRAFSGRRSTEYTFELVDSRLKGVEAGLLWFKDIATGLKLTSQDIESIKGEVKQEFLGKVGTNLQEEYARSKMYRKIFPCEAKEADYMEYYNNNFSQEALKRFYEKWYNPDMFALSVVGNISNPDDLERLVQTVFSGIPPSQGSLRIRNCDSLYFNRPAQFVVVERKKDPGKFIEDKTAEIHFFLREPFLQDASTKAKLERTIDFKILLEIMSHRFKNAKKEYGQFSVVVHDLYNRGLQPGIEIIHQFDSGTGKKSVKKVSEIINQLRVYGVSEKELKIVKDKQLKYMKLSAKYPGRYWHDQIKAFYVKGEALPADKNKYLSKYLLKLTVDEFNNYLKTILVNGSEDIGIIAPSDHDALSLREEEVRGWVAEAFDEPVTPFTVPDTLYLMQPQETENLKKASFTEKETVESGAREFLFENGVKLVVKKNTLEDPDKSFPVFLHGFFSGGAKSLPEEDYWSAINAPEIIRNSGVNGLSKFQINQFLSGTSLIPGAVSPYIDYAEHGIYGRANRGDLEVMMQLVYLYFTRPNKNEVAFDDWKTQRARGYLNRSGSPSTADFLNTVRFITGDKSIMESAFRKSTPGGTVGYKSIAKTDFCKAFDTYKEFFENANGFTFIVTGDFQEEKVLSLAQKYLGNLPGSVVSRSGAKGRDTKELTEGPTFHKIPNEGNYRMPNVSYGVTYIKKANFPDNWQEQIKVEALGEVVRQKLLNLRFKKGYGLYDISARGKFNDELKRYEISSLLFCDPEDLHKLQQEVKNIFSEIKEGSFSSTELESALGLVNYFIVSETAERRGSFNHSLYRHYRYDQPWVEPAVIEEYIEKITKSDIKEKARSIFEEEHFHEFLIMEDAR